MKKNYEMLTNDEIEKQINIENKFKVSYNYCGHKAKIPRGINYVICEWCGHRINSKRNEFKEKLLNILKKEEVIK